MLDELRDLLDIPDGLSSFAVRERVDEALARLRTCASELQRLSDALQS
jgi:hypothetical protein